ncbi:MAG: hypothetical protein JSV89_08410 [Spirochaetaceae bacterium]|nr:MAG: hypothetical protein JSV89_08410 [Spirochaetaceae bacterium]
MRLPEVDRSLDYFEESIDLEHIRKIEQLNYDALHFGEIPYLPLTVRTAPEGFEPFPMEDVFDDPEKMLYNELLTSTFHSSYNSDAVFVHSFLCGGGSLHYCGLERDWHYQEMSDTTWRLSAGA